MLGAMRTFVGLVLLSSFANAAPLRGNVLVPKGVPLHATAAAARADAGGPTSGGPVAMRVIREHAGDVVELTTAATEDCVESGDGAYTLTVFVKRDKLYQRTAAEIVKTFPDGTAIAIDRGAPVTTAGAWLEDAFTAMIPPPDKLVHAVSWKPSQLPPLAGEPLVCDGGGPISVDEYRARRAREREATRDADRRAADARAEERAKARRAEREKEHAQVLAKRAKRKGKPTPRQQMQDDMEDLMFRDDRPSIVDMLDRDTSMSDSLDIPPTCGIRNTHAIINHRVVKAGTVYLADLGYHCGRTRILVDRAQIGGNGGGAMGMRGIGGQRNKVWIPRPGPVTWESGKPAGRYTGTERYRDVVEKDTRICVGVGDFAELVCHPRKTTATAMD
jgi:hypothetical protein